MNIEKVKIILQYGYQASINDISSVVVSPIVYKMILDYGRPPHKLDILSARAAREKMLQDSAGENIIPQINSLMEENEITQATFDFL